MGNYTKDGRARVEQSQTIMSTDKNMERHLTTITVVDDRGTSMAVTLYIAPNMLQDYLREAVQVWADQWCGKADHVFVKSAGDSYEWIKPGDMKEQQPHTP